MSVREKLEILEKVSEIATLAGVRGKVDEERMCFVSGFGLPNDRSQMVYVRPMDRVVADSHVVTFFSPCLAVKHGFMKGVSKEQALDLLKKNEEIYFARYGIRSMDKEDLIVASIDSLLNTLDPEEFHSNMWHVAIAADNYEKEHGQDDF